MIIRVTICQSIHYEKHQKSPFFRPSDPFVTYTPHFLGSKFEYSFTNPRIAECAIRVLRPRISAMPISNSRSDECTPERGNEPPAQGIALGEQG